MKIFSKKKKALTKYLLRLFSFIIEFFTHNFLSAQLIYSLKKMFMKHNFTLNHLTRFIYKETSVAESMAIRTALQEDWNLFEEYQALKKANDQLPKVTFNPSPDSIQNILRYSKETAVEAQH